MCRGGENDSNWCIHHGDVSELARVQATYLESSILSWHKREGALLYKFACNWMVYVALRLVHYGATTKVWSVGISSLNQVTPLIANLLSYAVHLEVLAEHQL